ncbi:hypothetical protein K445DRAFT_130990 [Daldinia sp. EC12]|nr:hypothetical protein K445DRAFT_130990 [Daldinia sp. EC12]
MGWDEMRDPEPARRHPPYGRILGPIPIIPTTTSLIRSSIPFYKERSSVARSIDSYIYPVRYQIKKKNQGNSTDTRNDISTPLPLITYHSLTRHSLKSFDRSSCSSHTYHIIPIITSHRITRYTHTHTYKLHTLFLVIIFSIVPAHAPVPYTRRCACALSLSQLAYQNPPKVSYMVGSQLEEMSIEVRYTHRDFTLVHGKKWGRDPFPVLFLYICPVMGQGGGHSKQVAMSPYRWKGRMLRVRLLVTSGWTRHDRGGIDDVKTTALQSLGSPLDLAGIPAEL